MNACLELERTLATDQVIPCPKCLGAMVTKLDAIGRTYQRCPTCQGVAKPEHRIPGDVQVPQTLILSNRQRALPPIREGQLRCQLCAEGVEGFARFCVDCNRVRQAKAIEPSDRTCTGCGATRPRRLHEHATVSRCERCPVPQQTCLQCGLMSPRMSKQAITTTDCSACRTVPRRSKQRALTRPCKGCGSDTPRLPGRPANDCPACRT